MRYLQVRAGALSVRAARRTVVVVATVAGAAVVVAVVAVLFGDYPSAPGDALAALVGTGDDRLARVFVQDVRLPRAVAAVVVGLALGGSGAIFQSVSGNPLGSPDIIGFTVGSATGALVSIIIFGGTPTQVALGALAGGAATALVVHLLATRGGVVAGYQLVLVGVGAGAILSAVNTLLIVRTSLPAAQAAAQWLAGSLNAMTWSVVALAGPACALLCLLALLLSRPLTVSALGDEAGAALGIRPQRVRTAAVAVAVALVSLATAVAGPIAFVALAAPQLGHRLVRTSGPHLTTSMAMGAALVLACDQLAQRLFAPVQLPVGVVTGSLGGLYLIWLLAHNARARRP